jgi:hypothetical protein
MMAAGLLGVTINRPTFVFHLKDSKFDLRISVMTLIEFNYHRKPGMSVSLPIDVFR